jgi:diguanylate cyclase (GGDEF)-like protein/PAS domain S-box-containing protein
MLSVAALIFPSFYFLVLDRKVLRRLLRLNHEVLNIGETKGQRLVTIEGRDEIASLADSINRMLVNLRSSQEALKESERMNQTLAYAVLQSHLATVLLDREFRVSQANEAFLTLVDQPLASFKGREISLFFPDLSMKELNSICLDDIGDPWAGELEMRTPGGETLWTELSLSPILDSCQSTAYYLGIIKDITQLKGREAKARFEANHDYLTGLPNRLAFREELKKLRDQPPAEEGTYALLYTDLDGFKPVNDEYGHSEGDRVLKMMAQRFTKVIRDSDRLARVGGDEFCFLIHTETDHKDALIIANRLLETMNQPFQTETATHKLGISIGVAFYPQDTRDPEELYDLADQAMYVAKKHGKNRFALHNPEKV